jgi:predicted tellurium resistance membrane protein TerC
MPELLTDPQARAALVIPRGYISFAVAFAGAGEVFNVLAARQRQRRKN